MIVTTVSVYRGGALVAGLTGIRAKIDSVNTDIQNVDGGAGEYDSFMIYCQWANPDIHRGDVLQDEANGVDNYDVVSKPAQYPGGLCQMKAIKKWGT